VFAAERFAAQKIMPFDATKAAQSPASRQSAGCTGMAAACSQSPNWYALHTKPRQESLAQSSLQREGLETFFPKLRRRRTIRRVRKWVTGALFPSYIFARFDAIQSARLVKYANGVANIVSFGGHPAIVDEEIIAAIRAHAEDDVVTVQPVQFRPGDVVEIQVGPLRGLQGVFEREMSDRDRVVVLLDTLAQGARVQVSREQLERIAD
jgi:transcriptional antiterminator RfaH